MTRPLIPERVHYSDPQDAETMGSSFGGGAALALVRERWAEPDARRMAELDRVIREHGSCRFCGATVSDAMMVRRPGVCSQPKCKRRAAREGMGGGANARPSL